MAERPEDLNLPTPVVSKLISDCLPSNCKVTDEAKVAITKAASVFVLYATSQANTLAQNQSRKTIYSQDVISAMNEMEFEKFVRPLENSLAIWKKGQQEKKEQAAKKKASKKDVDAVTETGESKASAQEPEVIEID